MPPERTRLLIPIVIRDPPETIDQTEPVGSPLVARVMRVGIEKVLKRVDRRDPWQERDNPLQLAPFCPRRVLLIVKLVEQIEREHFHAE